MKDTIYHIVYAIAYAYSLLPFRVLYFFSDATFLLLYHLVRYRRHIVWNNLRTSFPEKSEKELRKIERGFYHFLCDYFNESLKLLSISKEEMARRLEFRGLDKLEEYFAAGRSCAGILGHYCNWEWLSTFGLALKKSDNVAIGLIYQPLRNKTFDKLFVALRSSTGGMCIPKNKILRYIVRCKHEGKQTWFGYIADQTPRVANIHLWIDFLNHDTPVFTGAERIMRSDNDVVFYLGLHRERRGKYVCAIELITDKPGELPEHEITRRFFALLEKSIRSAPQFYLWSHNRWKHTREEVAAREARHRKRHDEQSSDT